MLSQLEIIKEEESAVIGEEQPQKYTQEEVAEMLKIEESLLMRRLERVKETQAMLQEKTDIKTLTEAGKRSEKSIDFMQEALNACHEFNKEFKGETFNN